MKMNFLIFLFFEAFGFDVQEALPGSLMASDCQELLLSKDLSSDSNPIAIITMPKFYSLTFKLKPYELYGKFFHIGTPDDYSNSCYAKKGTIGFMPLLWFHGPTNIRYHMCPR